MLSDIKSNLKKRIIEYYYSAIRIYPEVPSLLRKNFQFATEDLNLKLEEILTKKYFDKQPD